MQLRPEDIYSKNTVGSLNGSPVVEVITTGGFVMLFVAKGGSATEPLGAGPHPVVARNIASRMHPDVVFSRLAKSDHIDIEFFKHLLPKYEALTARLVALKGK